MFTSCFILRPRSLTTHPPLKKNANISGMLVLRDNKSVPSQLTKVVPVLIFATRILGSRDTVDSNNALLSRGRKMIELVRATIQTTTRIIKTIDGLFQSINYLLSSSMDSFQSIHLYHQIYTKAQ